MGAFAPLALPLFIAGTATQVIGQGMAAREQSRAAAFEAEQLKVQEQQLRTQAAQDEANRRQEFNDSIATIEAIRAGRGVGMNSPTGNIILTDLTEDAESDISISKTNTLTKADQARMTSDMARRKARMSLIAGGVGMATTIAGAGFKYATLPKQ